MKYNCLVLPNDPLSIYVKQGNLDQFMDRFRYYADNLGPVYILNVDKGSVTFSYPNIKIINVAASKIKLISLLKQAYYTFKLCKKYKINFTRALEGSTFVKSALLGLVSKIRRIPFVCSIHGTYRGLAKTYNYGVFHKILFRFCEFITKYAVSLTFVIDKMYIDELKWKNMYLVPNFVDCKLFKPQKITKEYDAIYVGSLIPRKGIEYLVKTFDIVRQKFPLFKLAIIGAGPIEIPRKKGLIYLGPIPHNKLPDYYNKAKFFITATLHEGFAIPIIEAQACGLPIIATDLEPFHNNTIVGKTAFLSLPKNSEAMAKNIFFILDKENWKTSGNNARLFVTKKYNMNVILNYEIELIKKNI
ncbi:MAG: glycosyltransferase family 4 protein [Candidatus ainarchaeum sp.]|nr:glycosyltransferase family 4 protein [Candidatus ainarchaeum sp.]